MSETGPAYWRDHGVRIVSGSALDLHQEINASRDEPLSCVLVRSGQEPVVVNLDIAPAEPPEAVAWVDSIHPPPSRD